MYLSNLMQLYTVHVLPDGPKLEKNILSNNFVLTFGEKIQSTTQDELSELVADATFEHPLAF